MLRYQWALVREVSDALGDALTRQPERADPARAAAQHAAYVEALRDAGLRVRCLPADSTLPDSCFVEDMALVAEGEALLTWSGAPSRRAERAAVAAALPMPQRCAEALVPGATLDGGDCLRIGRTWFVGRSARTNAAGVEAVRRAFPSYSVVPVPVDELHLKCVASDLGEGRVLVAEGALPAGTFAGLEEVVVPHAEALAANVLALGRRVLVPAGFPVTAERLSALGFEVVLVDNSELRKADGALTCLSLLW